MLDPRIIKMLNSKDFKNTIKEYEKLAKQMQITMKLLEENAKLYSGLEMVNGEVRINEENDRVAYYKFMQEVLERLDRIEKRLNDLTKDSKTDQ